MKYNFGDDVRRALAFARQEAVELGHEYVGTEHQLLGLLRVEESRAVRLLEEFGATAAEVRARLETAVVRQGSSTLSLGELPYTSRGKKVLEFAMTSARDLKHSYVDTEHLLVGLLREEKGIAAQVLGTFGITSARLHVTLVSGADPGATGEGASGAARSRQSASAGDGLAAARAAGPSFRIELDDASDRSIYEQIVARVQEAVATGELESGARLPAVRQLADQLDIAPGTVARAYGELERLGVVVTEGARGTRIAEAPGGTGERAPDLDQIAGLLRPAAVAGFHMGAGAADMRRALEEAMRGIFSDA